jgi:GntR family transcriptional repressor for pyruvate dehydrogenase complex
MSGDSSGARPLDNISLVTETASDSAVRFIRAMIFAGELGPGDRLPPERDLGLRLGISRMTLRLALKALESTGYIYTTRGSRGGSRVTDAESLTQCWDQWMRRHAGELDDLFEFRTTVETRLASLAAERRTDDDMQMLELAAANERSPKEWAAFLRADMDIHRAIARAARSPWLERAMMAARGELFIPVNLNRLDEKRPRVHHTHRAILNAIRKQDATAAAKQMRAHIEIVKDLTLRTLEASGIPAGDGRPN